MLQFAAKFPVYESASEASEYRLLRIAKRGDPGAFQQLFAIYEAELARFIARKTGTAWVDDLLQETRLATWTGLAQFREGTRIRSWLFAIAYHKCCDHLRRIHRHPEPSLLAETVMSNDRGLQNAEAKQYVAQALNSLPVDVREILELYYFGELTLKEIGLLLDRNLSTVKTQFYRAHTLVSDALSAEGEPQTTPNTAQQGGNR
jgi:RNA polymerase sigma factor (sigma-70 family)